MAQIVIDVFPQRTYPVVYFCFNPDACKGICDVLAEFRLDSLPKDAGGGLRGRGRIVPEVLFRALFFAAASSGFRINRIAERLLFDALLLFRKRRQGRALHLEVLEV